MTHVHWPGAAGLTLLEVLFAIAIGFTLLGLAVPLTAGAIDDIRAAAAARYLAGRIAAIRMEAVRRSTATALHFTPVGPDYAFAVVVDGNGNGVRTVDIQSGIDPRLTPYERIGDKFPGLRFSLPPGVPDADGSPNTNPDGVRIGTPRILTMTPEGSCTSGTLYLTGRGGHYAVRTLGATGRTRVLHFRIGEAKWISR